MDFKKQFREELIKEDAWISLTSEQRESVVNMGEQQLQLYLVSQQRELLKVYTKWLNDKIRDSDELDELIDDYFSGL